MYIKIIIIIGGIFFVLIGGREFFNAGFAGVILVPLGLWMIYKGTDSRKVQKDISDQTNENDKPVKNNTTETGDKKDTTVSLNQNKRFSSNTFFVVGSKNYNLDKMVFNHIKQYGKKAYGNNSKAELKDAVEIYGKIYKYGNLNTKQVTLSPEPENPYDENAVAVLWKKEKIGYIKREETKEIKELISKGLKPTGTIKYGPYMTLDYDDKLIEKKDSFGMVLNI